ncbi:MAG: protein kinase [Verrucomicrobiota bacterium]
MSGSDRASFGPGPSRIWEPPSLAKMQALLPAYQFLGLHGRGGMGAVFKARQVSLNRMVAIKVLPSDLMSDGDTSFATRFRQEALTMARLSHPGIVSVFEAGEAGTFLYIVMEFVDGTDMAHMIQREGKLAPELALNLLTQVCNALHYAHQQGVVHRDIKPANLLLTRDGLVKVADFGLAKHLDDVLLGLTQANVAIGTPDFLAPEAWTPNTPLDSRADVYALGVMLYQMLTGEIPRGLWEMPSVRVGTDQRFDAVIERAMQPKPEARYQSSAELSRDLQKIQTEPMKTPALLVESEEHTATPPPPPDLAPKHRSPPATIGLTVVAVALLAGIVPWSWTHQDNQQPRPIGRSSAPKSGRHSSATVRDAARWLLEENAVFRIISQGREIEVKTEPDIPDQDFQIVYLWFDRWASSPPEPPPAEEEFEVLRAVTTLQFAFLRMPGLSDAPLAFLAGNTNLTKLSIACPEAITDAVLAHLAGLKRLEKLEIAFSHQVTGRGFAGSAWLNSIQELDFVRTMVDDDALRVLAKCPRLRQLKVEGTAITQEGLRALVSARKLSLLNVGGCSNLNEDDLIEVLPQFGQLRKLELPGAQFGDEAAEALAALTHLTELRLTATRVTDAGLAKLWPLSELELLDVQHTGVTVEGVAAFSKAHPRCRIER